MKLNKIVLGVAFAMGMASFAQAADDQGSGKVTFTGSIVDAPCSIKGDRDQTVKFDGISNTLLADGGESTHRNFAIELEKCDIATKKSVSVTFTGSKGALDGSLGTGLEGSNILINNGSGKQIKLGEASDLQVLGNGTNTLNFITYLKGSAAKGDTVKLGEFTSVANFTLAYQ